VGVGGFHDLLPIGVRAQRVGDAHLHTTRPSRHFDGIDLGQVLGDPGPRRAFVAARPHFAARRPEVDADGIVIVERHRLAFGNAQHLRNAVSDLFHESDAYPNYEGKHGASPRELLGILHAAASATNVPFVSPFVVLDEIEEMCNQPALYDYLRQEPLAGGFHNIREILDSIRTRLAERIEADVQSALGLVDDVQHTKLFDKYMTNVIHWVRGEKIRNSVSGSFENADLSFMAQIEERLDVGSDADNFRKNLVTSIGAWSIENPGKKPELEKLFAAESRKLRESYFEQVRLQIKASVERFLSFSASERPESEWPPETLAFLKSLIAKGYRNDSARDLVGFMFRRIYQNRQDMIKP